MNIIVTFIRLFLIFIRECFQFAIAIIAQFCSFKFKKAVNIYLSKKKRKKNAHTKRMKTFPERKKINDLQADNFDLEFAIILRPFTILQSVRYQML